MERGAPSEPLLCRLTQIEMSRGAWARVDQLFSATLNDVRRSEVSGLQAFVYFVPARQCWPPKDNSLKRVRCCNNRRSHFARSDYALFGIAPRSSWRSPTKTSTLDIYSAAERVEQALDIGKSASPQARSAMPTVCSRMRAFRRACALQLAKPWSGSRSTYNGWSIPNGQHA